MKSAFYVTTKDFCKRARFGALLAVGTLVSGPLLFLIITRLQGLNLDYVKQDMFAYHFAYLGISWIIFLAVCLHALTGCQKICLGLPASSKTIATWLMLATVALVVLLQLVTNGAYRILFFDENWLDDYWPLLGPLLFITTLILVGHYIFWSLYAPSFTRVAFWIALIVVMFWWFISRYYPNGYRAEIVPWSKVTLWEFVTLQLVSVVAWYQGTRAFAKVRSGTAVSSPQWQQVQIWWSDLLTGTIPERQTVPLSRWSSLSRLHWRDSCQRAVVVCGTTFGIAVLAVNLLSTAQFNESGPRPNAFMDLIESFLSVTLLFSFVGAIIAAVLVGEGINGSGRTEMKHFLAMAPLSDRGLNLPLFRNMAKAFAFTFLLIQIGLLLSYAGVMLLKGPEIFKLSLNPGMWVVMSVEFTFFTVVGFWIIAANIISIFWTGRSWFYYTMIGLFFGGIIFVFGFGGFAHRIFSSYTVQRYFEVGTVLTGCILILSGTVAAYVVACWRKLIMRVTSYVALLSWLISSAGYAIWFLNQPPPHSSRAWMFIISALFALIIAPFATIPLALSWNRHR